MALGVGVLLADAVGVGVTVSVGVSIGVSLTVGVGVGVSVSIGVSVGIAVSVAVGVFSGVVRYDRTLPAETIRQLRAGILALSEKKNIIQDVKVPTAAPDRG